jgi:hypothetical protein
MTAARQRGKLSASSRTLIAAFGAGVFLGGLSFAPVRSATTERIVADRHTGLALYGFDPVAYFADAAPVAGRTDIEFRYGGVTWRFRNEGNRAAFAANPEIYLPRFGGHDPAGIARGVATPGYPQLWARFEDRLYLFHSDESRTAFVEDPDRAIAAAEARWPEVEKSLVP